MSDSTLADAAAADARGAPRTCLMTAEVRVHMCVHVDTHAYVCAYVCAF